MGSRTRDLGWVRFEQGLDRDEVLFGVAVVGEHAVNLEALAFNVPLKVDSHRGKIADEFVGAFVESDVECFLSAQAGGLGEGRSEGGFRRAGSARNEDAAAPVVAAVEHGIEASDSAGDPLLGDRYALVNSEVGRDFDSAVSDAQGDRVLREGGPSIFYDPKIPE